MVSKCLEMKGSALMIMVPCMYNLGAGSEVMILARDCVGSKDSDHYFRGYRDKIKELMERGNFEAGILENQQFNKVPFKDGRRIFHGIRNSGNYYWVYDVELDNDFNIIFGDPTDNDGPYRTFTSMDFGGLKVKSPNVTVPGMMYEWFIPVCKISGKTVTNIPDLYAIDMLPIMKDLKFDFNEILRRMTLVLLPDLEIKTKVRSSKFIIKRGVVTKIDDGSGGGGKKSSGKKISNSQFSPTNVRSKYDFSR